MSENITIPRWIVDKAVNALRLNYNVMAEKGSQSCLRRQTASAYKFLDLYMTEKNPTEEQLKRISLDYIDGNI